MINRPGRFHYHFIMGIPTGDEVREYMEDQVEQLNSIGEGKMREGI